MFRLVTSLFVSIARPPTLNTKPTFQQILKQINFNKDKESTCWIHEKYLRQSMKCTKAIPAFDDFELQLPVCKQLSSEKYFVSSDSTWLVWLSNKWTKRNQFESAGLEGCFSWCSRGRRMWFPNSSFLIAYSQRLRNLQWKMKFVKYD